MSDAYVHWQDVTTRWNDNDAYGHLNNVVHHAIMDTAVNTWLIDDAGVTCCRECQKNGVTGEVG